MSAEQNVLEVTFGEADLLGEKPIDWGYFILYPFSFGAERRVSDSTDASLLERLRSSSAPANDWTNFVQLYTPLLFFWAQRLPISREEADDLVQDVFGHLLKVLPEFQYEPSRSFRSWLRTVAHRVWSRKASKAALPVEPGDLEITVEAPNNVEAVWEDEYRQYLVRRALELMQARFRYSTWKACWEVVVEGRDPVEVAASLEMTLGAVYAAKSRVLRELRRELEGLLD